MAVVETPHSAIIDSGHVGYVIGERAGGYSAVFGCLEHAPDHMRKSNRMVFRDEAIADKAKCSVCLQVLATLPSAEAVA